MFSPAMKRDWGLQRSRVRANERPALALGAAAAIRRLTAPVASEGVALAIFVMTAEPRPGLVASLRRAIEPLVHAPEAIQSAHIGGIAVVDDAVLDDERAEARPIKRVGRPVGSAHGRQLDDRPWRRSYVHGVPGALVVVVDRPGALLLRGERDVEVEVESVAERGRPGKGPAH